MEENLEQSFATYLTLGVIALYCGVSKVTVLRWIRRGQLPAFRLPAGHYRIHRNDFNEFLMKHDMPTAGTLLKKMNSR